MTLMSLFGPTDEDIDSLVGRRRTLRRKLQKASLRLPVPSRLTLSRLRYVSRRKKPTDPEPGRMSHHA
jgi:hypothetical protein